MTTPSPTPKRAAGRARGEAADRIRHELDALYPGRWALLLIPVCRPDRAHTHRARTGLGEEWHDEPCTAVGKRPTRGAWNQDAIARWSKTVPIDMPEGWAAMSVKNTRDPKYRERHLRTIAEHLCAGGNVGLAIPPGVLVIDADNLKAVKFLDRALRGAPKQRTRNGAHYFLRVPLSAKIKSTVGVEIATGVFVDLRTAGRGQIVCEPSVHASGTAYKWIRRIPAAIARLLACPPRILARLPRAGDLQRAASALAFAPPRAPRGGGKVKVGGRNNHLLRVGCAMRSRGEPPVCIRGELHLVNRTRHKPPLDDGEVEKILASVLRYPAGATPNSSAVVIVMPPNKRPRGINS